MKEGKPISKTIFLEFLFCPKNIWLKLNRPELLEMFELSEFEKHLMEQGNEVDIYARKLFPDGVEVLARGEVAVKETNKLIAGVSTSQVDTPAIFQATFIEDSFIARNDMLAYDEKTKKWDLYEVKGTNSMKENVPQRDHIDDITFQASVLKRAKVPVGKYFIIHLNNKYTRLGELDINKLFTMEEVTEKVMEKLPEIEKQMEAAKEYLAKKEEPKGGCDCVFNGRSRHCATFKYSNPHIPEYSVHDLSRIGNSKAKLQMLVEGETFDIKDVPEHMELSVIQWNQIHAHRRNQPKIMLEDIKKELSELTFPLYFFDYETFAPAIPAFPGFGPYKRIPFQFSLHILDTPEGEPRHVEYLHEDFSDPSQKVAELLEEHISPSGRIIVWNKTFEKGVNQEIASRLPAYEKLFTRLNDMIYDLKDIFHKQYYVDPGFKGSTSIKKVLPIMAPHMSYENLPIKEGGQASDAWWRMVNNKMTEEEKKQTAEDLKTYCGLDTLAMYAVWKRLYNL